MNSAGRLVMRGLSHRGRVRDENEDRIATQPDRGLAILADGMGGHQAGEVASRMAVDIIAGYFGDRPERAGGKHRAATASGQLVAIADAIQMANSAIYQAAHTRPDYRGMGSTVVVAMFDHNRLYLGHVGDSRLYRLRSGSLEQLTEDHSIVQELINRGLYTPQEARESLGKNLLTRALGVEPGVEADTAAVAVRRGDLYLLCSDGLTDVVGDAQIAEILQAASGDVNTAAQRLVDRANAKGGPDNISVILAAYYGRTEPASRT